MKRWSWVCLALAAALAHGQDVLTIDEALASARENNGDVRSAFLSVRAAEQDVKSARADFLPSVSANLSRSSGWQERYTGFNQGRTDFNSTNSSVSLDYRILDNGQRRYSFDRVLLS
ncbi:MAG: TolC family protein, partial [Fimbriimonadaceae bacterium]